MASGLTNLDCHSVISFSSSCAPSVDDQLELLCAKKLHVTSSAIDSGGVGLVRPPEPNSLLQDKENMMYQGSDWCALSPDSIVGYPGSM